MGRILACSDIHGQFDEFMELLDKANYDPCEDQLYLLGDYVDRGPKSKEVIEKIIELHDTYGVVALRGNHDWMMENGGRPDVWACWSGNGAETTIAGYAEDVDAFQRHVLWMRSNLINYAETEDFIFVHASIAPSLPLEEQHTDDLHWGHHKNPCNMGKLVVHGHIPVGKITQIHDQLFIDTGGVFGNKLSLIDLHTREIFEVSTKL